MTEAGTVTETEVTETVTERALYQRLNRRLRRDGQYLKTIRMWRDRGQWLANCDVGRFCIIDDRNILLYHHVNLEEMGRKLGVLTPYEGVNG